jgi:8-oxo-dGTP diphosphatase
VTDASVYLVRHAKAGSREKWTERDELRPLSKKGRRQAEGLVGLFRDHDVGRVVSSPYVRCTQTVRPLALDRGLPVELSDALAEGASLDDALSLLDELASSPAVLCSHGDVIPMLIEHLAGRGVEIEEPRDWKKGSTWALERQNGSFARARYLAPPTAG